MAEVPLKFAVPYWYRTRYLLYDSEGNLDAMIEVEGGRLYFKMRDEADLTWEQYFAWSQEAMDRIYADSKRILG